MVENQNGGQYFRVNNCVDVMRNPFSTADQVIGCVNDDNTHMHTWNQLLEMEDRVPEDTMVMRKARVKEGTHAQCRLNPRPMNHPYCSLNRQPIGSDAEGNFVNDYYYYVDLMARDRKACFNIDSIDSWRKNKLKFIDPYNNKVLMHSRLIGALLNSRQIPENVKQILRGAYQFHMTDYPMNDTKKKRSQYMMPEYNSRSVRQRMGGSRFTATDADIAEAILIMSKQISPSKLKVIVGKMKRDLT